MTEAPNCNVGVGRMLLHSTLWEYQQSGQYTDLTFYCRNGTVSAHMAIMAGVLELLGVEQHKEEMECLVIPDLAVDEVEQSLEELYLTSNSEKLLTLLQLKVMKSEEGDFPHNFEIKPEMPSDEELSANDSLVEYVYGMEGLDIKQELPEMAVEKLAEKETKHISDPVKSINKLKTLNNQRESDIVSMETSLELQMYNCLNCQKNFTTKKQFSRHMREVHDKQPKRKKILFPCEKCGEVYTSMRNVTYCPCKTRKRNRRKNNVEDPWERCLYQCAVCSGMYADRRSLRNHVIQNHKTDYKAYLDQFGDPEVACPKWQCMLCESSVKFSRSSIETHIRHQHTLSLAEYESQYGVPEYLDETVQPLQSTIQPPMDTCQTVPLPETKETADQ